MANNSVAWSYSALNAFETCPRRYYLVNRSKKVREPQSAATLHGNEVHNAIANYVKGSAPLPDKYSPYRQYADKVKTASGKIVIEEKLALNRNFSPTTYFAKDVWVRAVLDAGVIGTKTGVLLDWKTGRRKPDNEQLKLFAAVGFSAYPYIQTFKTGFVWLAENKIDTEVFHKEDAPKIWKEFIVRVQRLEDAVEADTFPPRPSGLCRKHCPVGKENCEFCGE